MHMSNTPPQAQCVILPDHGLFSWPGSVVTLMRITIGKLKSLVQCCECVAANTSTGKQTRSANSPIVTFQLA